MNMHSVLISSLNEKSKVDDNQFLDVVRVSLGFMPLNNGGYASCDTPQKDSLGGSLTREKVNGVMTYIFTGKDGNKTYDVDFVSMKHKLGLPISIEELGLIEEIEDSNFL